MRSTTKNNASRRRFEVSLKKKYILLKLLFKREVSQEFDNMSAKKINSTCFKMNLNPTRNEEYS